MTPPTKSERAEAIARCAAMIAEYCNFEASKMFTQVQSKSLAVREGRAMLIYHLHREGMSFDAIGKLVGRSGDHCRRAEAQGVIRMMGDDRKLLDSLPKIPSSLQITQAEVPPVMECANA